MINETYDSFVSSAAPYFYWEFLVNGTAAQHGIDSTTLNAGDVVEFSFVSYTPGTLAGSVLASKHAQQMRG